MCLNNTCTAVKIAAQIKKMFRLDKGEMLGLIEIKTPAMDRVIFISMTGMQILSGAYFFDKHCLKMF